MSLNTRVGNVKIDRSLTIRHRYRAYACTELLAGQRHSRGLAWVVKGLVCKEPRGQFWGTLFLWCQFQMR